MLLQYAGVLVFLMLGLAMGVGAIMASRLLSRRRRTPTKGIPYECGLDPIGPTWVQFKVSYFLYALLFVAFDVEAVFMFPWAVKFSTLGLFGFVEMIIFIGLLAIALWYAWKEGALEWI